MAKTFLAVAVASNLIAALLAEWPVNLLVAAGGVAGFALVEHLSRAAERGLAALLAGSYYRLNVPAALRPARGARWSTPAGLVLANLGGNREGRREPSSSCRRWPALGLTSQPHQDLVDNDQTGRQLPAWRDGAVGCWPRLGAGRCGEMTMRQMQSVDRSDRLTAILIMINVAALVLLAFVL
jgi:hypothetical protein